ncbi:hypothetical protein HDU83_001263, partial [Entophlyctis luteolus]
DFSKKHSIFLDSGANQHVGPLQLKIDNVKEIQAKGDLQHWVGDGSNDRIVLTAKHAFFQPSGSQDFHEIAKVINGMYCMNPLTDLNDTAREAASGFIAATKLGQPHTSVFHEKDLEGPFFMSASQEVVEAGRRISNISK